MGSILEIICFFNCASYCMVLDHNTVIFQKEKGGGGGGGGGYIYKSLVCKTPIVIKVDRNKNVPWIIIL